jgi:hypothetical protein
MLPGTVDLTAYHGDTWSQTFKLYTAPNVPLDLTGATVACWAKASRNGQAPVTLTTTVGPGTGEIKIALPASPVPPAGPYSYDIEVTKSGVITTWVRGLLDIRQDITNG